MYEQVGKPVLPAMVASSSNPTELSATLQGALIAIVPIVIHIMQSQGIQITETHLIDIIQQVTSIASICVMLFGAIRKLFNFVKSLLK